MTNDRSHDVDDPVAAANRLSREIHSLGGAVDRLRTYGKHNRHLIWGLVISLLFDLVLTGFVAHTAIVSNHNSHEAKAAVTAAARSQETQVQSCNSSNVSRAEALQLWTLELKDFSGLVSSEKAKVPKKDLPYVDNELASFTKLQTLANTIYAQKDCAVYSPKG